MSGALIPVLIIYASVGLRSKALNNYDTADQQPNEELIILNSLLVLVVPSPKAF